VPLHRKLEGDYGKGVLTVVELGLAVVLSVEADKWLRGKKCPRAWFSGSTRTWSRSAPATRGEEKQLSPAAGGRWAHDESVREKGEDSGDETWGKGSACSKR
jgi:hypothetical protein